MDEAKIILEYLKVFISWPAVGLALGLTFLIRFKKPITSFFERVIRGEGYGFKVEASDPSEQREEVVKKPDLTQTEDNLVQYIQENPEKVKDLYINIANGYVFERAFNLIYGTQIKLLEHLSELGNSGDKYVNLATFYHDFLSQLKNKSKTKMKDYIGFLRDQGFVEYFGEDKNDSVRITPFGLDFLDYIKKWYPHSHKNKVF